MGCCVCKIGELNGFEKIITISQEPPLGKEFTEVLLDSEPCEKAIEEWRGFKKNGRAGSFSESLDPSSTFAQSERKTSVYSRSGSIFDSFTVSYFTPISK